MKIAGIAVYACDLPYAGGVYHLSGGRTFESFDATIVEVRTACGLIGWGESTPFGATYIGAHARGVRAGIDEMAPSLIGCDPRQLDRLNDRMDAALAGHLHAKAPIDVACWDLLGQAFKMPVCDLLGGRIEGGVPVISSIHADAPEKMRAQVATHRARGFRGHSLKIGASDADGGPALDAERIQTCLADRQAGEWFQADANNGMSVEQARRLFELLPTGQDLVIEAPCASLRETLSLRPHCRFPLFLDELVQTEQDLLDAIKTDAADGVNLKISKQGGLTRSRRLRDMASAAGLAISVQETVGSVIAFAALLHVAQSTSRHLLRCALDTRAMVTKHLARIDAPLSSGLVEAPERPGLGIEVDRAALGMPVAVYGDASSWV